MEPDHPDLGIPGLIEARALGRGGFGTVYAVREPEFGRTVAVKVLRERLDDESVRRAFQRECQAMGSLSGHPHIVTVHRGGTTTDGRPYIVMDLMSGGSLADRLTSAPLPWPEVLDVAVLMSGALETAHRQGVLHLDLKPANILVSRYGEPKLGDFGIARLPGIAETSGQIRVSPAYAAPERMADGASTVRTDLYGLGATVYTLLTGAPAFSTGSDEYLVLLARVAREPLPDLRRRGIPDPVCRVLERLMAKDPDDRYARAADVALACQDAQRATGRPVTRPVIDGAPTAADEAGAPTDLAVRAPAPPPPAAPHRPTIAVAPRVPWSGPPPAWTPNHPPQNHPQPNHPQPNHPQPNHPAERPAGGRGPLLVAAAAILLVALAVTGVILFQRAGGSAVADPTADPAATSAATPTDGAPTSGTPIAGTPTAGTQAVAVRADVGHPETSNVRTLLQDYLDTINTERYADTYLLFSPRSSVGSNTLENWLAAQEPRRLSDAELTAVRDGEDATLEADWSFVSRQDPSYGPPGLQLDCLSWELTYVLDGPGPQWRILRSDSEPSPC